MSRISLVEESQAPLTTRPFYANGDPGPIISSLAHVPELLGVAAPAIGAIFGPSSVSARLNEIVVLRTSVRLRCRYCLQTHTAVALEAGLTRDEVRRYVRVAVIPALDEAGSIGEVVRGLAPLSSMSLVNYKGCPFSSGQRPT